MIRRPPRSTRTDTLFPYTTLCRSRLQGGETIAAPLVLSSLDAQATLRLTGIEHFDAEAVRRIRQVRCKGVTAKVNLALSTLDRKSTRLNSSHSCASRMPSSA